MEEQLAKALAKLRSDPNLRIAVEQSLGSAERELLRLILNSAERAFRGSEPEEGGEDV